MKIKQFHSKLIIHFNNSKTDFENKEDVQSLLSKSKFWKVKEVTPKSFLPIMESKFKPKRSKENKSYASAYDLLEVAKLQLGIPKTKTTPVYLYNEFDNKKFIFFIENVAIYTFETGESFLEFDLGYPFVDGTTANEYFLETFLRIVETNYAIKLNQLPGNKSMFFSLEDVESSQQLKKKATFLQLIKSIIELIDQPFNESQLLTYNKMLITAQFYSLMQVDEEPNEQVKNLIVAKSLEMYDRTYQQFGVFDLNESVKTFKNIEFFGNENGALALTNSIEGENNFFVEHEKGFLDSWRKDYFLMFLFLLHQKTALQSFMELTEKEIKIINAINENNLTAKEKKYNSFIRKYDDFMLTSEVSSLSTITHLNLVHAYYKKQMNIQRIIEALYYKIEHFRSSSKLIIEEIRQGNEENLQNATQKFTEVIGSLTIVNIISPNLNDFAQWLQKTFLSTPFEFWNGLIDRKSVV
jgi:hypothetical protein